MIADAGFRWVRMDLKWDATERERGRYNFSAYDRLMNAIEPFGMRALFILDYGNPLYGEGAPRTEAARNAFAKWAVAAAQHFANRGVIWEVYNEPNNPMFWQPPEYERVHAPLAVTVGRAFHESVPNEKLMGPAVGEMDFSFLTRVSKPARSIHGLRFGFIGISVEIRKTSPVNMRTSQANRQLQNPGRRQRAKSEGAKRSDYFRRMGLLIGLARDE